MRALILTNQLAVYAGSEIVALEVAETFLELGCDVDLFAGFIGEPIKSDLSRLSVKFGLVDDCPDPFSYDIIWSQHHILPYLLSKYYSDDKPWPFIANISLSPFEPYELPGAIASAPGITIANSYETLENLVSFGIAPEKIKIFHNAAPNRFIFSRQHRIDIGTVAIISNHTPQEVLDAGKLLERTGIKVEHIGLPSEQIRITPEVLSRYDAVITIGKTVQYCILSETPVFIYDKWGGPGWLTENNHRTAEMLNFSGRCSPSKKTPDEISSQLTDGYSEAINAIQKIKKAHGQKYELRPYLSKLIKMATLNGQTRKVDHPTAKIICREGVASGQTLQYFRTNQEGSLYMAKDSIELSEKIGQLHDAILNNERKILKKIDSYSNEQLLIKQIDRLNEEILSRDIIINKLREERQKDKQKYNEEIRQLLETSTELEKYNNIILSSRSWKLTQPLRAFRRSFQRLRSNDKTKNTISLSALLNPTRMRNGARYLARGDIKGLLERLKYSFRERATINSIQKIQNNSEATWAIMSTPHTIFIAQSIADHLKTRGIDASVMTSAPASFNHDIYIVLCAQMFDRLPPNERRILFQLEQSVSSRWFSKKYISDLENSLAIFDYSLTNIEFLQNKGIRYPHVHYIPIGLSSSNISVNNPAEKEYDFLFYGDSNSSPRRRHFLSKLQEKFSVVVYNNLFGEDMHNAIRKAKVVVNIHYYEGALLETPRIQECLSLGTPVLSEGAKDQYDYPELNGAVRFFNENSVEDMLLQAETILADIDNYVESLSHSAKRSTERFAFMLDRALVALGLLPVEKLQENLPYIPHDSNTIALSLPETISRRKALMESMPRSAVIFDGARYSPGWIGCGLSFKLLAMYALAKNFDYLTVFEDDALLPDQYESKMSEIIGYLTTRSDKWDIFSGLMAEVHPDTKILSVEVHDGIMYATVDRMVSSVCNIYNKSALGLLSKWDPTNHDVVKNAFDRYLQNLPNLHVVVAIPFIAGHREELNSTLWGFQNERYGPMIAQAEKQLQELAEQWLKKNEQSVLVS
ncbi:hypothetical protein ACFOLL_15805 [Falsochrobactrum ovis]|uniref:Uncharacterized protein n=1 Tax=Falsochrobactrum ovis TaxID=1293442 RepID=A0A364JWM7_9HYPH|nr:hypothetical protein [Falsochrobactrum ovis]RAK31048.1 hypothetical protein C7374_103187 [Falsochrobactrum ovis]